MPFGRCCSRVAGSASSESFESASEEEEGDDGDRDSSSSQESAIGSTGFWTFVFDVLEVFVAEELLDDFSDLVVEEDIDSFSKEGSVGIDAAVLWSANFPL